MEAAFDYFLNPERSILPRHHSETAVTGSAASSPKPRPSTSLRLSFNNDESAFPAQAQACYESITVEKELVWGDGNRDDY